MRGNDGEMKIEMKERIQSNDEDGATMTEVTNRQPTYSIINNLL